MNDEVILVSACLLGVNSRYDGGNAYCPEVVDDLFNRHFIPVCPEQLGGLPTPRLPSNIQGDGRRYSRDARGSLTSRRGYRCFLKRSEGSLGHCPDGQGSKSHFKRSQPILWMPADLPGGRIGPRGGSNRRPSGGKRLQSGIRVRGAAIPQKELRRRMIFESQINRLSNEPRHGIKNQAGASPCSLFFRFTEEFRLDLVRSGEKPPGGMV
jgi:hypothetical protein